MKRIAHIFNIASLVAAAIGLSCFVYAHYHNQDDGEVTLVVTSRAL